MFQTVEKRGNRELTSDRQDPILSLLKLNKWHLWCARVELYWLTALSSLSNAVTSCVSFTAFVSVDGVEILATSRINADMWMARDDRDSQDGRSVFISLQQSEHNMYSHMDENRSPLPNMDSLLNDNHPYIGWLRELRPGRQITIDYNFDVFYLLMAVTDTCT
jgi:hypothetical protein